MRRCTPAPEVEDDGAAPIPVSALLRREGRSAAGLPVQPPAVGEILATLPARQPLLRRGAIAAGALLAAGSVFGLTAAMNAPITPPTSSGVFPDQGAPGGSASPGVLDAGEAAPSTWFPVAFPTLFPEANSPAPQAAAPRAAARPAAAPVQASGAARQASSPATSAPRSTPATKKDGSSVVGGTVDTVGGVVSEVGGNTPLKPVTDGLGNTVSGVGRQVGAITDPIAYPITVPLTTTVKRVVAPLTTPVTTLLTPSTAPTSSSKSTTSTPTSSAKPSTSAAPTGIVKDLLG